MTTLDDIKETLQALVAVKEAARELLDEPSAIYKATRIEELRAAIDNYEAIYQRKLDKDGC